ncbi:flagellar hook-associated protein FlgK [Novispirillum itersonii]|uniref:Flagellar hook-associated protein 1 n=1 Tax=Novispirillum itersonii TaxID=189 RepID=A0A7X0DLK4_NOVIT|nr:flagellar hook-associated protein FlgK [Novispirillum itersonii]MBB6209269.1 flagellar hook-associated protein 1 FlgK [Novispirillum itersonii]
MTLNLALNAAISGLLTSQRGLDSVSHNIANVNTAGYSRKIFTPESVTLGGFGVGVQTSETQRRVDETLRKSLWASSGQASQLSTGNTYYKQMQQLFGAPGDATSIAHRITDLGTQLEQLALNSQQSSMADQTVRKASEIQSAFADLSKQLQGMRTNADQEIATAVTQVNSYLSSISDLNQKISLAKATGQGAADLQDKRDTLMKSLSDLMDVSYYTQESGAITIFTASGTTLLDNNYRKIDYAATANVSPWDSFSAGQFSKMTIGAADITGDIRSGKLRALIDMRDNEVPALQSQIDQLADTMKTALNAAHNRGTSYPTLNTSMIGTKTFIKTAGAANQTMKLTSGDVNMTIFNADGSQAATTTLNTIMQDTSLAPVAPALPSNGPWTMDQVAGKMQSWLQGQGLTTSTVAVDSDGKFNIQINSSGKGLAFRDQKSTNIGSDAEDVGISFDANADGTGDQTVKGFSNFLGLNDFYTSGGKNWQWESNVLDATYTAPQATTLSFSSETDGMNFGNVLIMAGDTPTQIAARINNTASLAGKVKASVVPDGSGSRVRITNLDGSELQVTRTGPTSAGWDTLGFDPSKSGMAQTMQVSNKLTVNSNLLQRGALQFNSNTGAYYVSNGDNAIANQMAAVFTTLQTYEGAGGLSTGKLRLADYGAAIISNASSRAAASKTATDYQNSLTQSLSTKDAEISAVNLDEELSQLMVFQQSYAAAAKVISTTKQMFDVLNDIIR